VEFPLPHINILDRVHINIGDRLSNSTIVSLINETFFEVYSLHNISRLIHLELNDNLSEWSLLKTATRSLWPKLWHTL